jgi:hypothetical protein
MEGRIMMVIVKKLLLAGTAFGLALSTAPAFAAGNVAGLTALSLRGAGVGGLAAGPCTQPAIACPGTDVCECLTVADTVVGTLAFNKGSLTLALSVDTTNALPITAAGSCLAATGQGTIQSVNTKQGVNILVSGFACSTVGDAIETFNGTYVITGGVGSFATANGTGAINGSQTGATSQAAISGTIQK